MGVGSRGVFASSDFDILTLLLCLLFARHVHVRVRVERSQITLFGLLLLVSHWGACLYITINLSNNPEWSPLASDTEPDVTLYLQLSPMYTDIFIDVHVLRPACIHACTYTRVRLSATQENTNSGCS